MTIDELRDQLLKSIESGNVQKQYDILVTFKEAGGGQVDAYNVLRGLRELNNDEDFYDALADLADIVSGWVYPDQHIWEKVLSGKEGF